jgi:hypothetical protein
MQSLTRDQAIAAIRRKLLTIVDDEHSMCQIAAQKGIYCHGFAQYTDEQLKERYSWLVQRHPGIEREELEDLANRWNIARQIVDKVPLACDAQQCEHDTCLGWDGFDNATLARYYRELLGHEIAVTA